VIVRVGLSDEKRNDQHEWIVKFFQLRVSIRIDSIILRIDRLTRSDDIVSMWLDVIRSSLWISVRRVCDPHGTPNCTGSRTDYNGHVKRFLFSPKVYPTTSAFSSKSFEPLYMIIWKLPFRRPAQYHGQFFKFFKFIRFRLKIHKFKKYTYVYNIYIYDYQPNIVYEQITLYRWKSTSRIKMLFYRLSTQNYHSWTRHYYTHTHTPHEYIVCVYTLLYFARSENTFKEGCCYIVLYVIIFVHTLHYTRGIKLQTASVYSFPFGWLMCYRLWDFNIRFRRWRATAVNQFSYNVIT